MSTATMASASTTRLALTPQLLGAKVSTSTPLAQLLPLLRSHKHLLRVKGKNARHVIVFSAHSELPQQQPSQKATAAKKPKSAVSATSRKKAAAAAAAGDAAAAAAAAAATSRDGLGPSAPGHHGEVGLAVTTGLHAREEEREESEEETVARRLLSSVEMEGSGVVEVERRSPEELKKEAEQRWEMEVKRAEEERLELSRRQREEEERLRVLAEQERIRAEEEERKRAVERAARRISRLPKLQEEHEFIAAKMFFYPEVVTAGESVEIFFHRSASEALREKPGVFIFGGFNDWQWGPFKAELKPTAEIGNDWWSVTLDTPPEAYLMNFVFHSSDNVYENNDGNDFYLRVEGEWDEERFETMLNEAKREEAERLAAEEAERDRIAREEKRAAELRAMQEAERAEARRTAEERRRTLGETRGRIGSSLDGVWYTRPALIPGGGGEVELVYNRAYRPLAGCGKVFVHGGVDNWDAAAEPIVTEMKFESNENGDWWSTKVQIPEDAVVFNWVLADGPPGAAGVWDNNNRQDFAALVGDDAHVNDVFARLEERVLWQLEEARRQREEAEAAVAAKRLAIKAATKARTKEAFLRSQAHVFYTEPAEPQAGERVRVYYNPTNTVLHGRTRVWMKGSFNRWTHRSGCFLPIEMTPAPNGTHYVAEVEAPLDSYIMDLCFLDSPDPVTATYDSRGGLDYHVPVLGGTVKEPPLYVVHVALEMAPIAKVGGLGDVVTSLSRAMLELGHKVEVVLPKYDCLKYDQVQSIEKRGEFLWGGTTWGVWFGFVEGIPVHFLEPQSGIFWVGCIYGRKDDAARFGTFCNAALEFLLQTARKPDILHCHDWSSAPVAWLQAEQYSNYGLNNTRTVFTIHNLEFGQALIGKAMAACNMATTVSPTYAREISGHGAVAAHRGKFHGILNGIDPDIWDPLVDKFIPMNYTSDEVVEGKRAARHALWDRLHLQKEERPLVGIITRLTAQKGIHLIKHAIWRTLDRGGQVVLLGSAPDPRVQREFEALAAQLNNTHNNMQRLWLSYDEPLSHLMYAACDMILVPSMFEPCGLTQLIAMRYGAIPVVRKTGGLNDTVFDVDNDKERAEWSGVETNGFSFEGTDAAGVDYALNRAISAWYEGREWWNGLAKRVMEQDWSWNRPSLDYLELYYGARK